jgi:hypothetical protein
VDLTTKGTGRKRSTPPPQVQQQQAKTRSKHNDGTPNEGRAFMENMSQSSLKTKKTSAQQQKQ